MRLRNGSSLLCLEETRARGSRALPHLERKEAKHMQTQPPLTAQAVTTTYTIIGWVLQGGVLLSAAVIVLGSVMMALQPDTFAPQQLQSFPQTFGQVWTGLLALRPQAIITLGLLVLIATPVMRVAVSLVAFAVERDWRFVTITLLVLLILLFSIFSAGAVVVVGTTPALLPWGLLLDLSRADLC